jgi:ABC-type uncharacterized transport system permease subunit
VPAEAIAGRLGLTSLLLMVAGSALAFWGAGVFWRFGLRHYTGASA